jgi:hypothetical protein
MSSDKGIDEADSDRQDEESLGRISPIEAALLHLSEELCQLKARVKKLEDYL